MQDFFNGNTTLGNGTYTKQGLIDNPNYNYTASDFDFNLTPYKIDPENTMFPEMPGNDYAERVYIYNNAGNLS